MECLAAVTQHSHGACQELLQSSTSSTTMEQQQQHERLEKPPPPQAKIAMAAGQPAEAGPAAQQRHPQQQQQQPAVLEQLLQLMKQHDSRLRFTCASCIANLSRAVDADVQPSQVTVVVERSNGATVYEDKCGVQLVAEWTFRSEALSHLLLHGATVHAMLDRSVEGSCCISCHIYGHAKAVYDGCTETLLYRCPISPPPPPLQQHAACMHVLPYLVRLLAATEAAAAGASEIHTSSAAAAAYRALLGLGGDAGDKRYLLQVPLVLAKLMHDRWGCSVWQRSCFLHEAAQQQ